MQNNPTVCSQLFVQCSAVHREAVQRPIKVVRVINSRRKTSSRALEGLINGPASSRGTSGNRLLQCEYSKSVSKTSSVQTVSSGWYRKKGYGINHVQELWHLKKQVGNLQPNYKSRTMNNTPWNESSVMWIRRKGYTESFHGTVTVVNTTPPNHRNICLSASCMLTGCGRNESPSTLKRNKTKAAALKAQNQLTRITDVAPGNSWKRQRICRPNNCMRYIRGVELQRDHPSSCSRYSLF